MKFYKQINLHACRYQVQSSDETGCFPCSFITFESKRLATTNMFCSFDMLIPRIFLVSDSIVATQSQINSEPTLIKVSSITYSEIVFFFKDILRMIFLNPSVQDGNIVYFDKAIR